MREIKFRGKRIDNGEWVIGDLWTNLTRPEEPLVRISTWVGNDNYEYTVIQETVGQLTGITDKDEIDIYEDDIIKISGRILRVIFDNGSFLTPWNTSRYRLGGWGREAVSKIGNIHDNPELLTPSQKGDVLNTMITDPNVKSEEEVKTPATETEQEQVPGEETEG